MSMLRKMKRRIKYLINKTIWMTQGGYSPEKFWEKWGRVFIKDKVQHRILPQHKFLLLRIKKEKPKSILEVGVGFGRNIRWLIDNGVSDKNIRGIDISQSMLRHARKFINNKKVILKKGDVLNVPFKNDSFDFVFLFAVLMHVRDKQIRKAIEEAIRVTTRSIVIIEQNYKPQKNEKSSQYTFVHDYKKIFKTLPVRLKDFKKDNKNGYNYYYFVKTNR